MLRTIKFFFHGMILNKGILHHIFRIFSIFTNLKCCHERIVVNLFSPVVY